MSLLRRRGTREMRQSAGLALGAHIKNNTATLGGSLRRNGHRNWKNQFPDEWQEQEIKGRKRRVAHCRCSDTARAGS